MRPESMHPGHRLGWPAVAVLALVPLMAAAMLLSLLGGGRTVGIHAAVVNLDEAVTVDGQVVPLGRQLAAEMVDRPGENLTWTLADEADAEAGLAEGRYSAVVVIPQGFSAAATSFSANDATVARQATVTVSVSENAAVSDAVLAQEVVRLATDALNRTLTTAYLENVYVGFNTVGEQFDTIVEAAAQLNEGGAKLGGGVASAAEGTGSLSEGLAILAAGGAALGSGAQRVAGGADELAGGVGALSGGAKSLSSGATALADGVAQLNAQTPQLASGVNQLTVGAEQLLGGIPEYTGGTVAVLDAVVQLRDGLVSLETGLQSQFDPQQLADVQESMNKLVPGLRELQAAISIYFPGVDASTVTVEQLRITAAALEASLQATDLALAALAQGTADPPEEVQTFAGQLIGGYECPVADPDTCQLLAQAYGKGVSDAITKGFQFGAQTGHALLNQPDPRTGQTPLEAAHSFTAQALVVGEAMIELRDALTAGLPPGTDPLTALEQLPTQLGDQMTQLSDGVTAMREGADTMLTKAQPLRENAPALNDGAAQLLTGLRSLNSRVAAMPEGTAQLASGSSQVADGAAQLAAGTSTLSLGARKLADGAADLAEGTGTYVDGVDQASAGAAELSDGMAELSVGAGDLSSGLRQFHTQLADGATRVPSYDEQARATLAGTVASPVAKGIELAVNPLVPVAALIAVVALWLGSMLATSFIAPVPSDLVSSSRSTALLWARTLGVPALLGAGQGILLGLVAGFALGLPGGVTVAAAGVLALLGMSFAVVNHALAGWLGNIGRGVSVLLLVATLGLGLTSRLPGWLAAASGVSPLHNGLLLIRTIMAQGVGTVGLAGGALLCAAIALGASYLALASRRRLSVAQFKRRVAAAG